MKSCPASIFGSDMFTSVDMHRVLLQEDPDQDLGDNRYLGSIEHPTDLATLLHSSFRESELNNETLTPAQLSEIATEVEKTIAKKRDTIT